MTINRRHSPASRPLRQTSASQLKSDLSAALGAGDSLVAAHCIHELWMRGEMAANIELALSRIWAEAPASIPEWLPMRHIEWLPLAYDVTARFEASGPGQSNIYLILLDYRDSRDEPFGIYVGMSRYSPAQRFDQHKAGIRAAGSVLRRGLEVLAGPTLHLQRIARADAERFEEQLAEALRAEGLFVQGGH